MIAQGNGQKPVRGLHERGEAVEDRTECGIVADSIQALRRSLGIELTGFRFRQKVHQVAVDHQPDSEFPGPLPDMIQQ